MSRRALRGQADGRPRVPDMQVESPSHAPATQTWRRPRAREFAVKTQRTIWSLVRAGLIVGVGFIIIYPLLVKIASSIMSPEDLFDSVVKWIPRRPTLQNYVMAFTAMNYPKALLNSVMLVTVVSVLQLASCTLVGYSLARYDYPGRQLISALAIFTLVVPPQLVLIPTYLNFRFFDLFGLIPGGVNLLGTYWPFVLTASTASGLRNGLFIFSMRQFFRNMPRQLQEAAYVDGASPFRTFLSVMLPNAGPALITVFLFSFVWQWNDVFYTSIFTGGKAVELMPYALEDITRYAREMYIERYGMVPAGQQLSLFRNAGALMYIAPVLILYAFLQRHFVESIERTGLVG